MKKLVGILAAACLTFCATSNALAEFVVDHTLTLSIYDTTVEYGYDLGYDVDLTQTGVTLFEGIDVSDTSLNVSVFFSNYDSETTVVGLTTDTTDGWYVSDGKAGPFNNTTFDILGFAYDGIFGNMENTAEITPSDNYWNFGANNYFGTKGNYNGFVTGGTPVLQPSLDALATEDFVDIYLYKFVGADIDTGLDATTAYAGVLRITSDGDVILNPVPIPGALVLISTGLLGVLGIRRKTA